MHPNTFRKHQKIRLGKDFSARSPLSRRALAALAPGNLAGGWIEPRTPQHSFPGQTWRATRQMNKQ